MHIAFRDEPINPCEEKRTEIMGHDDIGSSTIQFNVSNSNGMTIVCNVWLGTVPTKQTPSLVSNTDRIIMAVIYGASKHWMDRINETNDRAKSCSMTTLLNKTEKGGTEEKGKMENVSLGSREGNQPRIVRVSRTTIRSDGMMI